MTTDLVTEDRYNLQTPLRKDLKSPREQGKEFGVCVRASVFTNVLTRMLTGEEVTAVLSACSDTCACTHALALMGSAVTGSVNAGKSSKAQCPPS